MKKQIAVSIIMPVYNGEEHLRECLDVVCTQTLENFEVLCVDDCSTDNSYAILQEYAAKYPCMRVFQQPENMGAGPARNVGLKNARGEYIAFMDGDDYYPHKDTLKNFYSIAKEQNALIVGGGITYVLNNDKMAADIKQNSFEREGWIDFVDYQRFYYYQRFLFNREMIQKNKITFPPYLRFQDPPFFVRAMLAAERFYAVPQPAYVYRNESGHVTWTDAKINDLMAGTWDVMKLALKNGLSQMYTDLLMRYVMPYRSSRFIQEILEGSLINGNDKVIEFYRKIVDNYQPDLVLPRIKINMEYAETLAGWDGRRNMQYSHRPIELVDAVEEHQPMVSVVIPVYNTEGYIASCIDSILAQSLKDIEIICIDDGSKDNSGHILDTYEKNHENVKVYHQINQGLSAARNAGLQHAQGKYVYFMDSDDLLEETALEELSERAEKDQLEVLFFGAESFFDDEVSEEDRAKNKLPMVYSRAGEYPDVTSGTKMLVMHDQQKAYYTSVCIQFVRTDFIREHGMGFYEGLLHEDNLYTLRLYLHAQRMGNMDRHFFRRRIRANSIMTATVTYKNILGYYLSALEMMRDPATSGLQKNEWRMVYFRIKGLISNNIRWKWNLVSNAGKALFYASLTADDRKTFESFMLPFIDLHDEYVQFKKTANSAPKQSKAAKPAVAQSEAEEEPLRKNGIIGKMKSAGRLMKDHGLKFTAQYAMSKLRGR